jgi:hypothetical protein
MKGNKYKIHRRHIKSSKSNKRKTRGTRVQNEILGRNLNPDHVIKVRRKNYSSMATYKE